MNGTFLKQANKNVVGKHKRGQTNKVNHHRKRFYLFVIIFSICLFTSRVIKFTNNLVKRVFTAQVPQVTNLSS